MVPYDTTKEEETGGGVMEEEGGDVEEQEGGETEAPEAAPEGGNSDQTGSHGGRARNDPFRPLRFQTYKEAASKYYLHHTDNNMVGAARPDDSSHVTNAFSYTTVSPNTSSSWLIWH